MNNSAFIGLMNVFKTKKKINENNSIPLFIKNKGNWNIFKNSIYHIYEPIRLYDDFDIYDKRNKDAIYRYYSNPLYQDYIYHENDAPPKLSKIDSVNLYDYIRISDRVTGFPTKSYLPPSYKSAVYLIDGYKDHIFIPLRDKKGSYSNAIYFKFFIDTNPDLYWGKDLTSHGDIENQLRFIFGKDFDKFLYHPLELLASPYNSKLLDLPDYNMRYYGNDIADTAVLNIEEEPKSKYPWVNQHKQTELNFDEFYSNYIGFKCEPTYNTTELRKFFLYGFTSGLLVASSIIGIIKFLFAILL